MVCMYPVHRTIFKKYYFFSVPHFSINYKNTPKKQGNFKNTPKLPKYPKSEFRFDIINQIFFSNFQIKTFGIEIETFNSKEEVRAHITSLSLSERRNYQTIVESVDLLGRLRWWLLCSVRMVCRMMVWSASPLFQERWASVMAFFDFKIVTCKDSVK